MIDLRVERTRGYHISTIGYLRSVCFITARKSVWDAAKEEGDIFAYWKVSMEMMLRMGVISLAEMARSLTISFPSEPL